MRQILATLFVMIVGVHASWAQDRRPSHCIAIADAAPGLQYLHKAAWTDLVPQYSVRLRYVAHASFLLQTHGGLNVMTDYTGLAGDADLVPDVVTMNHAHSTHWTPFPDPNIKHVLPGWGPFGEGIAHYLDLGELLVRNVPTDIRSQFSGVEENGNSIFIFEAEGLCIGHLGHLHHIPSDEQFAAIGRLDVVMAPVDGGMTLPLNEMMTVLRRLKSSVVIPMHWFSGFALEAFLEGMSDSFAIERHEGSELVVSLRSLPDRPTIVVLRPRFLMDLE